MRGLADRGAWTRRVRGVYVVAGSPDTAVQRLVIAYLAGARAGGLISHLSAAAEHGLRQHPLLPHLTVPPKASAGSGTAVVHRSSVPPVDRCRKGALGLTSVARTLVDCAALLDRPGLEAMVDLAFCRRLADRDAVHAAADRIGRGRRGVALVREVVEVWSPGIEPGSPAEVRLLRVLGELGVAGLVSQHEVRDADGTFVARLDLAIPSIRRGLEYDGRQFHGPRRWEHDELRYRRLQSLGWQVESVGKADLLPGDVRLRDLVTRWAAAASAAWPERACRPPA